MSRRVGYELKSLRAGDQIDATGRGDKPTPEPRINDNPEYPEHTVTRQNSEPPWAHDWVYPKSDTLAGTTVYALALIIGKIGV